jgi:hypothetical protein
MSADQTVTATFTELPPGSGSVVTGGSSIPAPAPPTVMHTKCRKGFKKVKRHGKTVCMRVKKKHGKRH